MIFKGRRQKMSKMFFGKTFRKNHRAASYTKNSTLKSYFDFKVLYYSIPCDGIFAIALYGVKGT